MLADISGRISPATSAATTRESLPDLDTLNDKLKRITQVFSDYFYQTRSNHDVFSLLQERLKNLQETDNSDVGQILQAYVARIKEFAVFPFNVQGIEKSIQELSTQDQKMLNAYIAKELSEPAIQVLFQPDQAGENGMIALLINAPQYSFSAVSAAIKNKIKEIKDMLAKVVKDKDAEALNKMKEEFEAQESKHKEGIFAKKMHRSQFDFKLSEFWLKMSEASSLAEIENLRLFEQVYIFASGTLVFDEVDPSLFNGRHVVIGAQSIDLKNQTVQFNTSGLPGHHASSAPPPQVGDDYKEGDDVPPGANGMPAGFAGDIVLITAEVLNGTLKLVANGALGGNGQAGCKGKNGVKGDDGADGTDFVQLYKPHTDDCPRRNDFPHPSYKAAKGSAGKEAKPNRLGGRGGNSGAGSEQGAISVIVPNGENIQIEILKGSPGTPGAGGPPGDPAPGGKGGRHVLKINYSFKDHTWRTGDPEFEKALNAPEVKAFFKDAQGNVQAKAPDGSTSTNNTIKSADKGDAPQKLVARTQRLNPMELLINYITFLLEDEHLTNGVKRSFVEKILACNLSSDYLYALVDALDDIALFKGTYSTGALDHWTKLYKIINDNVLQQLSRDKSASSTGGTAWLALALYLYQKIQTFEELSRGGNGLGFGQIVNLEALSSQITKLIADFKDKQREQIRQQFGRAYAEKITAKIKSGKFLAKQLDDTLRKLVDRSNRNVETLLDEDLSLIADSEVRKAKLEERKKKLEQEMTISMGLSLLSMGLGIANVFANSSMFLSQVNSQALALKQQGRDIDLSRIQADIQKKKAIELTALEAASTQGLRDAKTFSNLFKGGIPSERIDNFLNKRYKDPALEMQRRRLDIELTQFANADQLALSQKKGIEEQQKEVAKQKNLNTIVQATGIAQVFVGEVANILATQSRYQSQIDDVVQAIKDVDSQIGTLKDVYKAMVSFNDNTIQTSLKSLLADQATLEKGQTDEFGLAIKSFNIKNTFGELKSYIQKIASTLPSSQDLVDTLNTINDLMQVQIDIYDRIERQKDFAQLGQLIVDAGSAAEQPSEIARKFQMKVSLGYLRNLYLAELSAFYMWLFPFGLSLPNPENSLTKELATLEVVAPSNDPAAPPPDPIGAMLTKIDKAHSYLAKIIQAESFATTNRTDFFLRTNFCEGEDGPYATVPYVGFYQQQINDLALGEKVTFDLTNFCKKDAVKYVSIFLYIPGLSNDIARNIIANMQFKGPAKYQVKETDKVSPTIRFFNQTPSRIAHCLDVRLPTAERPEFYIGTANLSSDLFEQKKYNTGRSPYCKVSIQLRRRDGDPQIDLSALAAKISIPLPKLIRLLRELEWIDPAPLSEGDSQAIYKVTASAKLVYQQGEISELTSAQSNELKGGIISSLKLFDPSSIPNLKMQFVGFGIRLNTKEWESDKTGSIPNPVLMESEYPSQN